VYKLILGGKDTGVIVSTAREDTPRRDSREDTQAGTHHRRNEDIDVVRRYKAYHSWETISVQYDAVLCSLISLVSLYHIVSPGLFVVNEKKKTFSQGRTIPTLSPRFAYAYAFICSFFPNSS
jgi:hypothetical protein